jgi:HAD superfamily hydrolase (TIGR01509 family)
MSRSRVEAVLLDMGGVMIPEVPGYLRAAEDCRLLEQLRQLGVEDPAALATRAARRVRECYDALAERCVQPDLEEALADVPVACRRPLLLAFAALAAQPPWSFVREVVEALAARHRLGLVSNTVIPGMHHARNLERAGVLRHIQCAVWSANFGVRKPDPAMIRYVLGRLGVPARSALFVGDKLRTDVLAAKRAGVRAVWLRRGPPDGTDVRPDFVIQDLRQLPFLLEAIG